MAPLTFEVLYYKRTNKVHKSKGVSKFDGVLTVDAEASLMTLKGDASDNNGKVLLFSGLQKDLARRQLHIDDLIDLGAYQIQILSVPDASPKTSVPPAPVALTRPRLAPQKINILQQNKKTLHVSQTTKTLIPIKRNISIRKPVLASQQKTVLPRKPPAQPGSAPASQGTNILLSHISLPSAIRSALRPHQVSGIEFLWNTLHGKNHGACCADEMGLGKSLMSIAILCGMHRLQRQQNHVIVAPSSLTHHWCKEFDKWIGPASQPKRVLVQGGDHALHMLRAWNSSPEGKVIIISYELCRKYAGEFQQANGIGLLLVDEGHRLKNAQGSQTLTALESIPSQARLLLTGTPIQNNLAEFYSVANFCCPGILGDLSSFRQEYEKPIAAANSKCASREQKQKAKDQSLALARITDTFLLRRRQRDILKSMLPPRVEALLFCQPSTEQSRIYRELTQAQTVDSLQTLMALRKLCCHPTLLDPTMGKAVSLSGKLVVLKALLQSIRTQAPDDKVVIVSNFTSSLSVVQELVLDPGQLSHARLDGTMDQNTRQNVVDTFQRTSVERTFCLLLSSKAGGVGLNLVRANRLVMLDADWNPALDLQAMARVYRQGQTKSCFIYRMFTAGTVEEIIYQRQTQKDNLSNLTVDQQHREGRFTTKEIKDCFTLKEDCPCETKRKLGAKWPDYGGPESLVAVTTDPTLLGVAAAEKHVLQFVHIVDENDDDVDHDFVTDGAANSVASCDGGGFDSDECEEEEFDL